MKWIKEPSKEAENSVSTSISVEEGVKEILGMVQNEGDKAIKELTEKFDGIKPRELKVKEEEIKRAYYQVEEETLEAVRKAAERIDEFACKQLASLQPMEVKMGEGVVLGHRLVPLNRVGCYVPAGRYPLPSSALMSIIPAKVAGVEQVMACAPPSHEHGTIHPLVLVAMDMAGVDEVYVMGGAQGIAAYAYGTESVAPADKVVGPGNRFVVEAKRQLVGEVGIDLLAGPSEAVIIADESADVEKAAVDLLARCEHDPDAVAVLVATDEQWAQDVIEKLYQEMENLETAEVAQESWREHGEVIVCNNLNQAVDLANERAPEHLHLMVETPESLIESARNYGSLFIGENSPIAFGDYCTGTNHILPTGGGARYANGLWPGSFLKILSYQKVDAQGAASLAPICSQLAEKEGLYGHKRSSQLRSTSGNDLR